MLWMNALAINWLDVFDWRRNARQIQLALEGLLAQGTVEGLEVGEALLVTGFDGLNLVNDVRELAL